MVLRAPTFRLVRAAKVRGGRRDATGYAGGDGSDQTPVRRPHVATIDTIGYPDAELHAESAHLRARARQTLRILGAQELAAFQEFGGAERLLVASDIGVHEFSYRPSPEDPSASTVGHTLTRWPNVKGVELVVRFPRADSDRYMAHFSIREPNIQASVNVQGDVPVPVVEFGNACVGQFERHAAR